MLSCLQFNAILRILPERYHRVIIALENMLAKERLDLTNEHWRELLGINVSQDEEHESMELDPDDDGDNSPFPDGKLTSFPCVPFDPSLPKIKRYLSHSSPSSSLKANFKELTHAYKQKHFTYVFDHLEGSPLTVFMSNELVKFFNKELKRKKLRNVIRALHAIHSLISNPQSEPKIIIRALREVNFFSHLFDGKCQHNYTSFCFLTKEIFIDILSDLFHKAHPREWVKYYLKWLSEFVEYFTDLKKPPHIYFNAIATSLVVGIEALPLEFYPSLIFYFRHLIQAIPRNRLSSHYLLKVWDKLMLFFRHWIRYLFSYPHLDDLNPAFSKLKFKHCKNPDHSVLQNDLGNRIIGNQMKYEYLFVEEGYVPCEFPLMPTFPKLPNVFPTLKDMEKMYGNLYMMVGDIIGTPYCEECKQSKCSCVSSYAIVYDVLEHLIFEVEKMQQLSPELSMEFENASLDEQNKPSCSEKSQFCFDPPDSSDEDMAQKPSCSEKSQFCFDPSDSSDEDMAHKPSCSEKSQFCFDPSDSSDEDMAHKPSCSEKSQFCFDPSDSSDEDMAPEEISDCYDSIIKRSPTISYSFSPDPILEVWKEKTMPDFTDIFPTAISEENTPINEQMEVVVEEQIQSVDTEFLNKSMDEESELLNNLVNEVHSDEDK